MRTATALVVALAFAVWVSHASAQEYQFGNTIYELPTHWELGRVDDYQLIYSDDDEVGYYATIGVHGGFELDGTSPEAALRQQMASVLDDDELAEPFGETKASRAGSRQLLVAAEKVDDRAMRLHALSVSNGWAYHSYLDARIKQEGIDAVSAAFSRFAATQRFVTDGAAPVLGRPTPGPLSGAFAGTKQTYGLNGLQFDIGIFQFSTTGRFYEGMPTGGSLRTIAPADALFQFPHKCGNYLITGDTIELRYATGEIDTMEFAIENDGDLELNGIHYGKLDPIADGTRLESTYRDFNYTSFTPGSGVTGGVASERTITLGRDGRWEATQFTGAFGNFDDGAGTTTGGFATSNDTPEQRGRYDIADGVLILTDDSGLVSRKSILVMEGLLLLDGVTYLEND